MKKPTPKKPIKYMDEPIIMGEIVTDVLPPPHLLVPKDDTIKLTLADPEPPQPRLLQERGEEE
jgi:hypothetical protein